MTEYCYDSSGNKFEVKLNVTVRFTKDNVPLKFTFKAKNRKTADKGVKEFEKKVKSNGGVLSSVEMEDVN